MRHCSPTREAARWQICEHRGDRALAHNRPAALAPDVPLSLRCRMRIEDLQAIAKIELGGEVALLCSLRLVFVDYGFL